MARDFSYWVKATVNQVMQMLVLGNPLTVRYAASCISVYDDKAAALLFFVG